MKKFLLTIPLQVGNGLKEMHYRADGNSKLEYEEFTRFPIIPVMSSSVKPGEKIKVVPVLIDNPAVKPNYDLFMLELNALSKKIGFSFSIDEAVKGNDERIETILKLFSDLLSKVDDEDELYACLTYGTKPVPIVMNMVLNYAYKCKKDVSVESVVYGQKDFTDKTGTEGEIFDITSLFYMDSIVNKLGEMKVSDPEASIKAMLGL